MRRLTLFIPLLCLSVFFSSNSFAQQCTAAHLKKAEDMLKAFDNAVSLIPDNKMHRFPNVSNIRSQLNQLVLDLRVGPQGVSVAHFNGIVNETKGLMKTFHGKFKRYVLPHVGPTGLILWHAFDSLLELW